MYYPLQDKRPFVSVSLQPCSPLEALRAHVTRNPRWKLAVRFSGLMYSIKGNCLQTHPAISLLGTSSTGNVVHLKLNCFQIIAHYKTLVVSAKDIFAFTKYMIIS